MGIKSSLACRQCPGGQDTRTSVDEDEASRSSMRGNRVWIDHPQLIKVSVTQIRVRLSSVNLSHNEDSRSGRCEQRVGWWAFGWLSVALRPQKP